MNCRLSPWPVLLAFSLAWLGIGLGAGAATLYVDERGNDSNPGSPERPLCTLSGLSRRIWAPGDKVLFHGGQCFTGVLRLRGGGSDAVPVIFGSYGEGMATLNSKGDTLVFGGNTGGYQFQDLNLKSSFSGGPGSGIYFVTDAPQAVRFPSVTVKNCELHGFGGPGIKVESTNGMNPGWTKIRVENCRVTGNGDGMTVYGSDERRGASYAIDSIEVTKSEFAGNRGTGLSICGVSSGLVDLCSFHDNQRVGGCWTWAARNVVIQRCISFRNRRGSANDGFGFDLDGGSVGCSIQYCLSYENDTAGFAIFDYPNSGVTSGNAIRYCISENDVRSDKEGGSFAINTWANTPIYNSQISNCVAYLTSRRGRSVCAGFLGIGRQAREGYQSGTIAGCVFRNNLVHVSGEGSDLAHLYCKLGASAPSEINFQSNEYDCSSSKASKTKSVRILSNRSQFKTVADWAAKTGQERATREAAGCGLVTSGSFPGLGNFHKITNPALLGFTKLWPAKAELASCLGDRH